MSNAELPEYQSSNVDFRMSNGLKTAADVYSQAQVWVQDIGYIRGSRHR